MKKENTNNEHAVYELINLVQSDYKDSENRNTSIDFNVKAATHLFQDVEMAEDMKARISELQYIANSIEQKVVNHKLDNPSRFKIHYNHELNEEQLSAVLEINNPLLVIAGAGSGKTRVITNKVSYLIEKGYLPEEIVLLTSTRKSSKEMLNRVDSLLKRSYSGKVMGGTFHSFSNYILRKYHNMVDLPPNFTIIDTQDAADIVDMIKAEIKIGGKKDNKAFPRKSRVYEIISKSRNLELPIDTIIDTYFSNLSLFKEEINLINKCFNKYKKASNLLDYDDLIDKLRNELRSNKPFREALQNKFKYILVDEYQDTNNAQNEIVELITGNRNCVTVVGDDMQSIYSFRGANFENILRFLTKYANCKVVKIEKNYRSNNQILNLTNSIVESSLLGFKKTLTSNKNSTKLPVVKKFYDEDQEASYIVEKILELREKEVPLAEIAVLVRAT
jgi:DNA helicase-2/ATP-dependent DNA helicase PcrA